MRTAGVISNDSAMNPRTAFLLRCSNPAAETIREKARQSRRSISGYVLGVLDHSLHMEEILSGRTVRLNDYAGTSGRAPVRESGAETAILVRCTDAEADRVRAAARRRDMSISAFVMHCLRQAWSVETGVSSTTAKTATHETVAVSENSPAAAGGDVVAEENPTTAVRPADTAQSRAAKSGTN